jgi:hypothetical protein
VTFTRTGGVDVNSLPNPAGQSARVVSPAESLHGSYHLTRTFTNGLPRQQSNLTVRTDCLRTGDRCMSYFHGTAYVPMVFGAGNWIVDIAEDGTCPESGSTTHVKTAGKYPLPQPPQNPIMLLSGHGQLQQSPPCALSVNFDETFRRTGD